MKITKKDRSLLNLKRNFSKITLAELSEISNIPKSTIFDRLKKIKQERYFSDCILINTKKLSLKTYIYIIKNINKEILPYANSVFKLYNMYYIEAIFENYSQKKKFECSCTEILHRYKINKELKKEGFTF